jgi:hypothetical protein
MFVSILMNLPILTKGGKINAWLATDLSKWILFYGFNQLALILLGPEHGASTVRDSALWPCNLGK